MWLRVTGRVQGVGFRYYVVRQARRLGATGYARNLPDGSVEIRAEGSEGVVQDLIEAVRRGPSGSRVDGVDVENLEHASGGAFSGFEVRY